MNISSLAHRSVAAVLICNQCVCLSWVKMCVFFLPGIPTSSQPTMTVTAQRRQPPVVPLTLTSDLHLQQSPQQLSPTLSSPVNITQVQITHQFIQKLQHTSYDYLKLSLCALSLLRLCQQSRWPWSSSSPSTHSSTSWRLRPRHSCWATCRSSSRPCRRASSSSPCQLWPPPAQPPPLWAAPPPTARARPRPASASAR